MIPTTPGLHPYNHGPDPQGQPQSIDMTADTAAELHTIIDLIRYGASRFNAAGLTFGHSYDNAVDEATQLVLHTLHLPHDLGPAYGQARVTTPEKAARQILKAVERNRRRALIGPDAKLLDLISRLPAAEE